jgi:homogentisate phytyltransferase/homogentisate geranylgeranyltransferase
MLHQMLRQKLHQMLHWMLHRILHPLYPYTLSEFLMDDRSPKSASTASTALYAFWKFSRPHTIIGTTLSVAGIFAIARAQVAQPFSASWEAVAIREAILMGIALFACLCGNVYIVGLNQLEDVDIDRVNKPHLPLASGEFSRQQGWAIVVTCGLLALMLAAGDGRTQPADWHSLLIAAHPSEAVSRVGLAVHLHGARRNCKPGAVSAL